MTLKMSNSKHKMTLRGSIRDDTVVAAAEAAGVTLYFTGIRHFYH